MVISIEQMPCPVTTTWQPCGIDLARDTLQNSGEIVVVRIGMRCKAQFAANSRSYWQEMQRRREPEPVLPQLAGSDAECPKLFSDFIATRQGRNPDSRAFCW